jgi:hypothetical protein
MIHIATVHWNTDRWIAPQLDFLRRHLKMDFRVYAWLNNIPTPPHDLFYYSCSEAVGPHAIKLNILADIIIASAKPDDVLIFLDGDAFPVADIERLIADHLKNRKVIAVQRLENNGDIQPHPCFCVTTPGFWKEIKGDWNEGYRWKSKNGLDVTDVGGNLMKQLIDRRVDWLPLLRSNNKDLHPLFFGVYGGVVYHHGAGFRKGESRADHAHMQLNPQDKLFSMILPGYGRSRRKKAVAEFVAKNHELSERVFVDIVANPKFYEQFS